MQHLTTEALARLVDEPPDRAEAAHLEGCAACRDELQALRRQTAALAALGQAESADPPPEQWDAILAGLSASAGAAATDDLVIRRRTHVRPWLVRAAAAVLLYALGTGTGLALRGRTRADLGPRPVATTETTPRAAAPQQRPALATQEPAVTSPAPATQGNAIQSPAPDPAAQSAGRLASDDGRAGRLRPLPEPSEARTPEEALQLMAEFEQGYSQAYTRLAELRHQQPSDDPVTQIAALNAIVLTPGQALDRAPADPLINGYHLAAMAQRDAALRQVALRSDGRWF